jgi:hypothetical protein
MSSKVVTATKIHIEYDDIYFDGEDLKEEANEVKPDDENVSSDSKEIRMMDIMDTVIQWI